jgi:hypothetical protein
MIANYSNLLFANATDFSAVASTNAEAGLLQGQNQLPAFPALMFDGPGSEAAKTIQLRMRGVISTTGTPTVTFQVRLGTSNSPTNYGGSSLGVSAAITTINNSTTLPWELTFLATLKTKGLGSATAVLTCEGWVESPTAFAAPYKYLLIPSQGALTTWTQTFDASAQNYLNVSMIWSASSSSNTITTKHVICQGIA